MPSDDFWDSVSESDPPARRRCREPQLRLTLFGQMRAEIDGNPSALPRMRKTRALLALLGLAAGRPVSRSHLMGLLWSQRRQEQARASLRQATHELYVALGSPAQRFLHADRDQIRLAKQAVSVDAVALEHMDGAPRDLLRLLRGPLLEDLRGIDSALDQFLIGEHQRLVRIATTIGEGLLHECRSPIEALEIANDILRIAPTHQHAWTARIATHLAHDDRTAALAAFECYRVALATGGGQNPAPEIEALLTGPGNHTAVPFMVGQRVNPPTPRHKGGRASPDHDPRTCLVIRPFASVDGNQSRNLASGLTAEITSAFARFHWLSCVAAPPLTVINTDGMRDGTRYDRADSAFTLEGSVQCRGASSRIIATVSDADGRIMWTRRFDRLHADMHAVQQAVAAEVCAQVDLELVFHQARRRRLPMINATKSQDLLLRAIPGIYGLDAPDFHAAGEMLEEALLIDSTHAAALAWSAYWHLLLVGQGWTRHPAEATTRAMERAQRAVALDPTDARALTLAGHIHGFLGKRPHDAKALHERAIALNPNVPLAWCFSGLSYSYLGSDAEAIRRLSQAHQLSPHDPHSFFFDTGLMMPFILRGQYDSAVDLGRRAIALNPGFSSAYKVCLSALGYLHRREEAADIRSRLLDLEPEFRVSDAIARSPMVREQDIQHYAEGLRRAGLPE